MVYRTEKKEVGLIIRISPDRKHGNGAKGGGRKNTSGKKAVITKECGEKVTLTRSTTTDLLRAVRVEFKIPHNIQINRKGETRI